MITSIEQLLSYLKNTKRYFFYVGHPLSLDMLPCNDFLPTFEMLLCHDPYQGTLPFIKVPESFKNHKCVDPILCQNTILNDSEVITYMKTKDESPNVVYFIFDSESERLCRQNGLNIMGVTAKMFDYLGNKVKIVEHLKEAEIPFIPNIISKINSYEHLLEITSNFNSSKLVIQGQDGMSGSSTFFVLNEEDYKKQQVVLQSGELFKIMAFRRLHCFDIDCIALKSGTILGPVMSTLIGYKKLTDLQGGYCGNEFSNSYFEDQNIDIKIRRQISEYAEKFGNYLYKKGFLTGVFGFDFAVDMDSHEVFFLEINPRVTGTQALTSQTYSAQGHQFPLFVYYCAEFLGLSLQLNIQELNKEWEGLQLYSNQISSMPIISPHDHMNNFPLTFQPSVWVCKDGKLKCTENGNFRFNEMKDDEIYFVPCKGILDGHIFMKKKCRNYNLELTAQAQILIDKFLQMRKSGVKLE